MSPLPLVYVHGAGPQEPMKDFKHENDLLIFGKDMPTTRVGYYANVRWPAAGGGAGVAAAAAGSSRPRRVRAIRAAMAPELSADAAAARIVAATLKPPAGAGRGAAAAGPAVSAKDVDAATALVEELYREADRIANRSPRPKRRGQALNISFPDPIFRFVVGKFASDVIDYLYGPFKQAMRDPVKKALLATPAPKVVVAHSLGTIITYDVLTEPELAGLKIDVLFTLGCPLGSATSRSSSAMAPASPIPCRPARRLGELLGSVRSGRAGAHPARRVHAPTELRP